MLVGQAPRELTPYQSPLAFFGAELRRCRTAARLSQTDLGHKVNYSGATIGKIEKAERWPHADLAGRCDEALGLGGHLVALLDAVDRQHHAASHTHTATHRTVLDYLPEIRRALDARDCPADGPVRPAPELRREVQQLVRWRLDSDYHAVARRLSLLLPELHRARQQPTPGHAGVATLLTQAYRAADAIADKFGQHDLSARIIDLTCTAAAESGDELTIAAAAYVRGETFFANGDCLTGCRILDRAAAHIHPATSADAAAAYGALHMRAAVLAARGGDLEAAAGHINEAAAAARHVPEAIYRGTAFGPASVRIHHLSLSVDSHDIRAALRSGDRWSPPATVPAERRSHYFIDMARAHLHAGHPDQALEFLDTARRTAPQHVRHHPQVKDSVATLLAAIPRPPQPLLRLAKWTGTPAPVNGSRAATPAGPPANRRPSQPS
jgi:transcriptional regulator with XRE-family HTH domain